MQEFAISRKRTTILAIVLAVLMALLMVAANATPASAKTKYTTRTGGYSIAVTSIKNLSFSKKKATLKLQSDRWIHLRRTPSIRAWRQDGVDVSGRAFTFKCAKNLKFYETTMAANPKYKRVSKKHVLKEIRPWFGAKNIDMGLALVYGVQNKKLTKVYLVSS